MPETISACLTVGLDRRGICSRLPRRDCSHGCRTSASSVGSRVAGATPGERPRNSVRRREHRGSWANCRSRCKRLRQLRRPHKVPNYLTTRSVDMRRAGSVDALGILPDRRSPCRLSIYRLEAHIVGRELAEPANQRRSYTRLSLPSLRGSSPGSASTTSTDDPTPSLTRRARRPAAC